MGKIFYLMGKSSSGKDTLYEKLEQDPTLGLYKMIPYTTRPIRDGEKDGETYYFKTEQELQKLRAEGKVIEERCYQTVYGPWYYFTADDGQVDPAKKNYLAIGTLESYRKILDYYGQEYLIPLYIEVEDGLRLTRAIRREQTQEQPKYEEMCRRFLADAADFSEQHLKEAGIRVRYSNNDTLEDCLQKLKAVIIQESAAL